MLETKCESTPWRGEVSLTRWKIKAQPRCFLVCLCFQGNCLHTFSLFLGFRNYLSGITSLYCFLNPVSDFRRSCDATINYAVEMSKLHSLFYHKKCGKVKEEKELTTRHFVIHFGQTVCDTQVSALNQTLTRTQVTLNLESRTPSARVGAPCLLQMHDITQQDDETENGTKKAFIFHCSR